jgi:hypothetical protein
MKIRILIFSLGFLMVLDACNFNSLDDFKIYQIGNELRFTAHQLKNKLEYKRNKAIYQFIRHHYPFENREDYALLFRSFFKKTDNCFELLENMLEQFSLKKLKVIQKKSPEKWNSQLSILQQKLDSLEIYLNQNSILKNQYYQNIKPEQNQKFINELKSSNSALKMALLGEKQLQIIQIGQQLLKNMEAQSTQKMLLPYVSINKDRFRNGEMYQARVYLLEFPKISTSQKIKMTFNNQPIKVNEYGFAQIKFKAQGRGEQTWRGTFQHKVDGRDTTFKLEKKYFVVPK